VHAERPQPPPFSWWAVLLPPHRRNDFSVQRDLVVGTVSIHTITVAYKSTITNKQQLVCPFAMGDPLSVLGAAVGVTSLIIQLADKCVKGLDVFKHVELQLI
jgi:hypothetical protein